MSFQISHKEELKEKFANGKKPSQDDFAELIDSCYGYVSKADLNEDHNVLLLTVPDEYDGGTKTISVSLVQLSLPLVFDYVKNTIRLGDKSEPRVIGYWKPGASPVVDVAPNWISTASKVGIKTDDPEADLHVNGKLKLKNGEAVDQILSVVPNIKLDFDSKLPTLGLVDNIANGIRESLEAYSKLVGFATMISQTTQQSASGSFQELVLLTLPEATYAQAFSSGVFTAAESGIYRVDLNLFINDYTHGDGTGIAIEIDNGVTDYIWVTFASFAQDKETIISTTRNYRMDAQDKLCVKLIAKGGGMVSVDMGPVPGSLQNICITRVGHFASNV